MLFIIWLSLCSESLPHAKVHFKFPAPRKIYPCYYFFCLFLYYKYKLHRALGGPRQDTRLEGESKVEGNVQIIILHDRQRWQRSGKAVAVKMYLLEVVTADREIHVSLQPC